MGGQTTFAARTADRFLLANFRKESTTYGKESDKQYDQPLYPENDQPYPAEDHEPHHQYHRQQKQQVRRAAP
jgi:hypothetical protein